MKPESGDMLGFVQRPPVLAVTIAGPAGRKDDVKAPLKKFDSARAIGDVEALVTLLAAIWANAFRHASQPNGHATALALSQFARRAVQTHDARRCG
jgi:hypothetical protein